MLEESRINAQRAVSNYPCTVSRYPCTLGDVGRLECGRIGAAKRFLESVATEIPNAASRRGLL